MARDARPNLVLFMPDQLRADAVGCFGNAVVQTPAIDALAARGTRFTSAWSQHPVCGPSRASIMTGWYPHVAGHRTIDHLLQPWEPNLLRLLRDAGYYVAMPGHRGDTFAEGVTEESTDFCGWLTRPDPGDMARLYTPDDEPESARYRGFYFGCGGDEPLVDSDEALIRTAEEWLAEGAPGDRPWALWLPLIFPHPPFAVAEPWFSLHDRADVPEPIAVGAGVGKAAFMEAYRDIYGWGDLDEADLREIVATYYGMISRVDDQLRRVMGAVEGIGQEASTGWVFFTDHGEYLGDYSLVEKWPSGLDPQLVANPLIISMPGFPEGQVCSSHVEMVDLLPTLLDLAEGEATHTHFGRSVAPLLEDSGAAHRDAVFCEGGFRPTDEPLFEQPAWIYEPKGRLQHEQPELAGTAMCIRTDEWSYVHRRHGDDELYDRLADPYETVNLLAADGGDGPDESVVARLRSRLFDWLADTSDVIPWTPDPRSPEIPHGWRDP